MITSLTNGVNVDLSAFDQPVARLDFRFESSDMGQWGINTPTYFAIDDLSFTSTADIKELSFEMNVYPNPVVDVLNVSAPGESGQLLLTDLNGNVISETIFNNSTSLDASQLGSGAYIVQLINTEGNIARSTFIK